MSALEYLRFIVANTRAAETFAIRAESPNSPRDPRDRAVVTVDYRRYHRITGLERNEIVRRHVGAKQAKKVTIAEYGRAGEQAGRQAEGKRGRGRKGELEDRRG